MGTDFQESNGCWDNLKLGPMVFGTKCSWDFWSLGQFTFFWDTCALGQKALGQNVVGTFGFWDKSLDFRIFLGQKALGQNVIGTIHLGAQCQWDNSSSD